MAYYKLIREKCSVPATSGSGISVPGRLYRTSHYVNKRTGVLTERLHFLCATLENADHLIPALIYRVTVTRSPKFKRLLPLLQQVPGRSGIRFHRGSLPEHSKGCILVSAANEQILTELWLKEQKDYEETRIEIVDFRLGA